MKKNKILLEDDKIYYYYDFTKIKNLKILLKIRNIKRIKFNNNLTNENININK